jgi:hypothetical protein
MTITAIHFPLLLDSALPPHMSPIRKTKDLNHSQILNRNATLDHHTRCLTAPAHQNPSFYHSHRSPSQISLRYIYK